MYGPSTSHTRLGSARLLAPAPEFDSPAARLAADLVALYRAGLIELQSEEGDEVRVALVVDPPPYAA